METKKEEQARSEEKMRDFDWMKARAECSTAVIFEQLKLQLRHDVEKAQLMRKTYEGLPPHYAFRLTAAADGRTVTVLVQGSRIHDSVSFRLTDTEIEVIGTDGGRKFSATPTLNANRECRLKVGKDEYELWYVMKMALEELFFRAY